MYDALVKKVNAVQTIDTNDFIKNTKINEIKNKINDHDHHKYITTQKFSRLTSKNFAAILKQANLVSKNDISDFTKKTDFDDKLKNINKKVTSNKTRHMEVTKKLNDLAKKLPKYQ